MKTLLVLVVSCCSISAAALYGLITKECDNKYYLKWTNLTHHFVLQQSINLTNWCDLIEVRNNSSMKTFMHPLENTNDVLFFRILILEP